MGKDTDARKIDEQRRLAEALGEEQEKKREQFVRNIIERREGIAADREKFLEDLNTGSIKKM